jgi:hypothetical protein
MRRPPWSFIATAVLLALVLFGSLIDPWVSLAAFLLAVGLAAVYALTRFVVWAAQDRSSS